MDIVGGLWGRCMEDVVEQIFNYVDVADIERGRFVSRCWRRILRHISHRLLPVIEDLQETRRWEIVQRIGVYHPSTIALVAGEEVEPDR